MKNNDIFTKIESILLNAQEGENIKGKWLVKFDLINNIVVDYSKNGELYRFDFPYRNAYFSISKPKGNDYPVITLKVDNTELIIDEENKTIKDFHNNIYQLNEIFKNEHLSFAPAFPKEFKNSIININIGERLSLNSGQEYVCIEHNNDETILKNVYAGDIFNITLDNFRKSEIFKINNNDNTSIQKLYCDAYNKNCSTLNIRVRLNNVDGINSVQNIEKNLNNGDVKHIHIGNLKLNIAKEQDKCYWYGPDGDKLKKHEPEAILGWAANSIPLIESFIGNEDQFYRYNSLTDEEFTLLNNAAFESTANKFINTVFDVAKNKPVFIGTTGLEKNGDDYDLISYVFYYKNNERKIMKCIHDRDNIFPIKIENTNIQQFSEFYNNKYKDNMINIINKYNNNYYINIKNISKNEAMKIIINEHLNKVKENNENPVQLAINHVSDITKKLLNEYIEDEIDMDK